MTQSEREQLSPDPTADLSQAEWRELRFREPEERGEVHLAEGEGSRKISVPFSPDEVGLYLRGRSAIHQLSPELTQVARESRTAAIAGIFSFPQPDTMEDRDLALTDVGYAASAARRILPVVRDFIATQHLVEPLTTLAALPRQMFNAGRQPGNK